MSRETVLDAARAYARRHPRDLTQRELLARLEGRRLPPLDVGPARARMAAAAAPTRPAQRPVDRPVQPMAAPPARDARYPVLLPAAPPGATHFLGRDGAWKWVHLDPAATDGRPWQRLAVGLVAAGAFRCLRVRRDVLPDGEDGHARFQHDLRTGEDWVDVVVAAAVPAGRTGRVLAHELAHVADELVRLEKSDSATAWRQGFASTRRTARAEKFAVSCEEWVTTNTTAYDLLTAARDQRPH